MQRALPGIDAKMQTPRAQEELPPAYVQILRPVVVKFEPRYGSSA